MIQRPVWRRVGVAVMSLLATVGTIGAGHALADESATTPSVYSYSPSLALNAARVRLELYTRAQAAAPAVGACPLIDVEGMAQAAAVVGPARGVDLRFAVDSWHASTTIEPELRLSTTPVGQVGGAPVVRCTADRPADGSLTRPEVFALVTGNGVSFDDVARFAGIETALPLPTAALGGQVAGSCQETGTTGVCVAIWQSSRLLVGLTMEGPAATVNPDVPDDVLAAIVPRLADTLAVRPVAPASCDGATIRQQTNVALVTEPTCFDGWATAPLAPCPITGCTALALFHVTPSGWRSDGMVDATCAENFVAFGMTGVTAQKFAWACDPAARELRTRRIAPSNSRSTRAVGLQVALVAIGYDVPVDGRYGPLTQAAVVHYQQSAGLIVDGIAGSQTQGSLGI